MTANYHLRNSLFLFASLLLTFTVLFVYLEAIFWFGNAARWFILISSVGGSAVAIAAALIIHYRIKRGRMNGSSDEELASMIGDYNPSIKDKLLNAIQIDVGSTESNFSQELIDSSIERIEKEISNTNITNSIENKNRINRNKTLITTA